MSALGARTVPIIAPSPFVTSVHPLRVGKTPESRTRPQVVVRQESLGKSLLRSRTTRLKSRLCPTPDNLAPYAEKRLQVSLTGREKVGEVWMHTPAQRERIARTKT